MDKPAELIQLEKEASTLVASVKDLEQQLETLETERQALQAKRDELTIDKTTAPAKLAAAMTQTDNDLATNKNAVAVIESRIADALPAAPTLLADMRPLQDTCINSALEANRNALAEYLTNREVTQAVAVLRSAMWFGGFQDFNKFAIAVGWPSIPAHSETQPKLTAVPDFDDNNRPLTDLTSRRYDRYKKVA